MTTLFFIDPAHLITFQPHWCYWLIIRPDGLQHCSLDEGPMSALTWNWYQTFFVTVLHIKGVTSGICNMLNEQQKLSKLCLLNVISSNDIRKCFPQASVFGT